MFIIVYHHSFGVDITTAAVAGGYICLMLHSGYINKKYLINENVCLCCSTHFYAIKTWSLGVCICLAETSQAPEGGAFTKLYLNNICPGSPINMYTHTRTPAVEVVQH